MDNLRHLKSWVIPVAFDHKETKGKSPLIPLSKNNSKHQHKEACCGLEETIENRFRKYFTKNIG